jgi:hypothetical protein
MQPLATALQACPCLLLQAPLVSHVPAQRPLGSSSFLAATQVWLLGSHAMQVPVQSLLAQQGVPAMQAPPVVQDLNPDAHA